MSIQINGTTGISGVDGTAGSPALQGADTNTGISFGTDEVSVVTGGTERVKVDSSGRLLVGTTTEGAALADNLTVADSGDCGVTIRSGATNYGSLYFSDATSGAAEYAGYVEYNHNSNYLNFGTNGTGRMRVLSNGALAVGTTGNVMSSGGTTYNCKFVSYTGNEAAIYSRVSTSGAANVINNEIGSGTRYLLSFDCGATRVGDITSNGSSTTYGTSSDYRLKENVVDLDGAITRVKQLAPKRFNFIADSETTVDGFLAHEAQTVVPEAVTGTHNEVDDEGNPVYQGIDQSKLVPLLTAALQEAIAKIETLEAKVAALEGGAS